MIQDNGERPGKPARTIAASGERAEVGTVKQNGYWYGECSPAPEAVHLLELPRRYGQAERKMRAETRGSMGMNETDLSALRFLLRTHRGGMVPRQRDLVDELGISHASVSALIDRLCRGGYAERVAHPIDRRSVGIVPTEYSDAQIRATLQRMHAHMLDAATPLSATERRAVAKFLEGIISSVEPGQPEPQRQPKPSPQRQERQIHKGRAPLQ
ncbi:UNVERIFIED_CONTAM: MarR family winged helix-turn-helix transcriptional regulator [Actinomycetes bacterium ARC8]|nr:MarR family winged helix-turn-helix transcriptional regulator [Actinomycetes bacterium ARC8]